MREQQLDLFSATGISPERRPRADPGSDELIAADLDDAALVAAIPWASLAEAPALAAEAGRRGLVAAVPALEHLCRRFAGFGLERAVPEQVAALEALALIGGSESARTVGRMIAKDIIQGPTRKVAVAVAAQLKSALPVETVLALLRDADPKVPADACRCAGPWPAALQVLLDLADDSESRRNTGRKDECPEPFEGPARQPLAIKDFLDLYGTHYAHATVYGAWGRNVTTYTAQSVSDLVAQSSEFEHSLKIGLQVPAPEGEPTKGGFSVGRTDGQAESGSRRQEAGSEVTTTGWHCVGGSGGSCEHGVDRGSRLVPVFLDLRALDGLLGPPHFTDPRIIVDLRRRVQAAIIERLTQQAARNPLSDAPPFRHYELELDALSCTGSGSGSFGAASCQPLIDAADLLIYGRLANGAKVDLSPAQNYPLATFVAPASPPPSSPSPAGPPRSVVFVAGQSSSGSGIDQIALSVAPRRSQRDAGEPTADGCCGEVVLAPTGCSIKTGERRDCVAIGNQQSCGSDYPVYEDLPCPSRALAPGERVLAWALRPRDGEAAPRGVLGRTIGEVAIPYRKEPVSTRFDTALLQMSLLGSQDELSISGTLRSIDLSQQLGVPREPQGLAIAFEAPAPTTALATRTSTCAAPTAPGTRRPAATASTPPRPARCRWCATAAAASSPTRRCSSPSTTMASIGRAPPCPTCWTAARSRSRAGV